MDENNHVVVNELGEIKVSEEVVGIIASTASADVDGVAGMSGGFAGGLVEMLGRKNLSKGVKVEVGEKEAAIDLFIVVEYGYRIPEVCWEVQEKVKKHVGDMTGLDVIEVNVHIQGVSVQKGQTGKMHIADLQDAKVQVDVE